jgi:hypothetical protein
VFKVETNIEQFKKEVNLSLSKLIDGDKLLREAAFNAVALISNRVQQEGKKSDGSLIKSDKNSIPAFKNNKTGKIFSKRKKTTTRVLLSTPYNEEYAKKRFKQGLEINKVDLTFSGDMMGDFIPAPEGKTGYAIGFRGQHSSDKADWNERLFGTIFQLSTNEANLIQGIVTTKINEILNKPS